MRISDRRPAATGLIGATLLMAVACGGGAGAVAERVRAGDALMAQKRYGAAAAAYLVAFERDGSNPMVRTKLGEAYKAAGQAIRAAELLPDDFEAQLRAGQAFLAAGRFEDAEVTAARLERVRPESVDAILLHANARLRLWSSYSALERLAPFTTDPDTFERLRVDLRPRAPWANDNDGEKLIRKAMGLAKDLPEATMALVNFYWATGRIPESEPVLRPFADANPGHAMANFSLGMIYLAQGKVDDALRYLRNAAPAPGENGRGARFALVDYYLGNDLNDQARAFLATMEPGDDAEGELTLRHAAVDARFGKPADAVRRVDAVLARYPAKTSARLLKAELLFERGNPDRRYVRDVLAADRASSDAHLLLGQVLASTGDIDGAYQEYREAARLSPSAVKPRLALSRTSLSLLRADEALLHAKDALRLAPDSRDAALALVDAFLAVGDPGSAESSLRQLRERAPQDPRVAALQGRFLAARGDQAGARAAFLQALELNPGSLEALDGLVAAEARSGPTPGTRQKVEDAVARNPGNTAVLLMAARLHVADRDDARAETMLRQALVRDPSSVDAGLALSDLLARTGRTDDAIAVMRRIVDRRPARYLEVWTSLARLLERAGRDEEAVQQFEQIVVANPDDADISYRLALRYLDTPEKLNQALELAMAAKRGRPRDPDVDLLLGRVYSLKGLTGLALGSLRAAVDARPDSAVYRFHLASALERGGNLSQARTEYARALQLDPAFPGAEKARQMAGGRR